MFFLDILKETKQIFLQRAGSGVVGCGQSNRERERRKEQGAASGDRREASRRRRPGARVEEAETEPLEKAAISVFGSKTESSNRTQCWTELTSLGELSFSSVILMTCVESDFQGTHPLRNEGRGAGVSPLDLQIDLVPQTHSRLLCSRLSSRRVFCAI